VLRPPLLNPVDIKGASKIVFIFRFCQPFILAYSFACFPARWLTAKLLPFCIASIRDKKKMTIPAFTSAFGFHRSPASLKADDYLLWEYE